MSLFASKEKLYGTFQESGNEVCFSVLELGVQISTSQHSCRSLTSHLVGCLIVSMKLQIHTFHLKIDALAGVVDCL